GALLLSSTAHAGNGGFAPVDPASPNAERIEDAYYLIAAFAIFVFLLVTIPLAIFIVRFRSRGRARTVEGPQIRGNTSLELAWTAVPVVILAIVAGFVFYKLPGITELSSAAGASELEIEVEGRQFYWQYTYPNGVIAIDQLRVPVDRVVRLEITAPEHDVVHSYWIPAIGGKFDAIPGETTELEFKAEKEGVYPGQCTEFCGLQHGVMTASLEVVPATEFDSWLEREAQAQETGESELGQATFEGACAKCHGMQGEGLIGPALAGNPLVEQEDALEDVVRNGRGQMPAVGRGWDDRQFDALFRYMRSELGGGSGG
ncbi:MAG: cytochrome c oxidase subunit II, partial [Actinomycetota bacterium]|nr:cytochrome c oxidase subunit II [Actinomycetota bacterium]